MSRPEEEYREFVGSRAASLHRTAYLLCGDWHLAAPASPSLEPMESAPPSLFGEIMIAVFMPAIALGIGFSLRNVAPAFRRQPPD